MGALDGRTAVLTGAGRGIGREVALLLAKHGANVIVNDPGVNIDGTGHDDGPATQVTSAIVAAGGKAQPNFDTVATVEGGENMIKQALDAYGRVDIVVHLAGILRDRMIFNTTEEEWNDVIAVHLDGYFNVARPASVLMRQQRYGRIIGFTSGSGLAGNSGQANYGAAKAGIVGMTRCLALDLGRYGVTANAVAPGAATRMAAAGMAARRLHTQAVLGAAGSAAPASAAASATQRGPGGGMSGPEYVAPMVAYLCTEQAWNINGKVFYVAGGAVSLAHDEYPVRLIETDGMWEPGELRERVPALLSDLRNPAPPAPDLVIPGRPAPAGG
ncbi:MAG: SDR family oxidoreductase [Dehalococcoidia bacterium]|nr:SDR family oxidoreductase [Dehalococcoidia bacterium]